MVNNRLVVVSFTSWVKRIGNVYEVLKSIMNQDVKADAIEFNLSLEEFPGRENDLPVELVNLINENSEVIHLNWLEGNDKVFKKIIPAIKKYADISDGLGSEGEERYYYLLSIDDDWIYSNGYIKMMIEELDKRKDADLYCLNVLPSVIGNRVIYKSCCFSSDFYEKLTREIIDIQFDDTYIMHYIRSKKKRIRNDFKLRDFSGYMKKYNPVYALGSKIASGEYDRDTILRFKGIIESVKF